MMGFVMGRGARTRGDTDYVIDGRPDLRNHEFGITTASKHPPYVFSIRGASALVHKVARVRLHWFRLAAGGDKLVRVNRPLAVADCVCGQFFRLEPEISRTCRVPEPDALLCGRCHGEPASFGKHGAARGAKRMDAHIKLGCVVNGY